MHDRMKVARKQASCTQSLEEVFIISYDELEQTLLNKVK